MFVDTVTLDDDLNRSVRHLVDQQVARDRQRQPEMLANLYSLEAEVRASQLRWRAAQDEG